MDEMRIESTFTTAIVSKLISALLSKKLGYKICVRLNSFNTSIGDEATVHLDADIAIDKTDIPKLLKELGLFGMGA